MKFSTVSGVVLSCLIQGTIASPGLFKRAACNADNCLRAVRASARFEANMKDCSSFAVKTVTPCPVTVTASFTEVLASTLPTSVTTTSTTTLGTEFATVTQSTSTTVYKRAATDCAALTYTPSNTPTYASACSGTVRYSSACSCAGATGSVLTLQAVTITVSETSTQISTETPLATETAVVTSSTTIISTATEILSIPAATCTNNATPNHLEHKPTDCACYYDVDCSASFNPNVPSGQTVFSYPLLRTVTECRNNCDTQYSNCLAFIFDPSVPVDSTIVSCRNLFEFSNFNPAAAIGDSGNFYIGKKTTQNCDSNWCLKYNN